MQEETGLTLTSYRCRGVVTFLLGELTEYMFLYTADAWTGTLVKDAARNEGILEWVPKEQVEQLPIWRVTRSSSACSRRTDPFSRSNSDMKMIRWLKSCWTEKTAVMYSFACQKRTRKAPATSEAREARVWGCSPPTPPKK